MYTQKQRDHWDRQAPLYAAGEEAFGSFLSLYEADCYRFIEPLLPDPAGALVLEAGCGTGRWVYRLAPQGYQVVMADLSPEMIRRAREKVKRQGLSDRVAGFHALDICDLSPLPDAGFDLILALGGPLSLCSDPARAVAEFHRLLRPGGHVVCDAGNRYRTALQLCQERDFDQVERVLASGHFARPDGLTDHRFTPAELRHLFENAGLAVQHVAAVCPFFGYLPRAEDRRCLDDQETLTLVLRLDERYAEDPAVVALSGRLLIVAHLRQGEGESG